MSEQRTDFVPLAPVQLIRPNGMVRPFGLGAADAAARGAALAACLAAWQSGDHIRLGPGRFTVPISASPNLSLGDGDVFSISGAGPYSTIVEKNRTGPGGEPGESLHAIFVADGCEATFSQITFDKVYSVFIDAFTGVVKAYNVGSYFQGFDINGGQGGRIDWYNGFTNGGAVITASTNLYNIDLDAAGETLTLGDNSVGSTGAVFNLYHCTIRDTHPASAAAVRLVNATVTLNLYGCVVDAQNLDFFDDGEGATVTVDAATVFNPAQVSVGTFIRRPTYGTTPTTAGLALLGGPNAAAQRVALGVEKRIITLYPFAPTADVETGDGAATFRVPTALNGGVITATHAMVNTAGTTGDTTVQIARVRSGTPADVLGSDPMDINSGEVGSDTGDPGTIDTANDDLATGDILRIDVDAVSTTKPKGLQVTIEVTL